MVITFHFGMPFCVRTLLLFFSFFSLFVLPHWRRRRRRRRSMKQTELKPPTARKRRPATALEGRGRVAFKSATACRRRRRRHHGGAGKEGRKRKPRRLRTTNGSSSNSSSNSSSRSSSRSSSSRSSSRGRQGDCRHPRGVWLVLLGRRWKGAGMRRKRPLARCPASTPVSPCEATRSTCMVDCWRCVLMRRVTHNW